MQLSCCSIVVVGDKPERISIGLRNDTVLPPQIFTLHIHETMPALPVGKELFGKIFYHLAFQYLPEHSGRTLQACQGLSYRVVDIQHNGTLGQIAKAAIRAKVLNCVGQCRRYLKQPNARQVEEGGVERNLTRTPLV